MSEHSEGSSPLNPYEAEQAVIKSDIGSLKTDMKNLTDIVTSLAQDVRRIAPPPYNPHQEGTSQPYVPQTPIVPPPPPRYVPPPPPPPLPQDPQYVPPPPPPPEHQHDEEFDRVSQAASSASTVPDRRHRNRGDDDRGLKIDLPEFDGSLNPDDYLDWISGIERVFDYKEYSEEKKFRVAILKFKGYASLWWESVKKQRERDNRSRIRDWTKLKSVMEKRFLPREYKQDLYQKLHTLKQEKRTVAEYIREFENLKIRCDVPEAKEHTIARFIGGLYREIGNAVELQQYKTFDDVCKLALKVERQRTLVKMSSFRSFSKNEQVTEGSSSQSTAEVSNSIQPLPPVQRKRFEENKPQTISKPLVPKESGNLARCFKCHGIGHFAASCPNRRVMTLREFEEVGDTYQEDKQQKESFEELEAVELGADEGELLVIRQSMPTTLQQGQRETIFHTRCTISGKVCSLIIDSGSCVNVASTTLVEKLGLPTTPHPHPCKLQWLNNDSELQLDRQVRVSLSIGNEYVDEILCDVIPMDACHILLGRPWQFDKRAMYDGRENTYTFWDNQRSLKLTPLAPPLICKPSLFLAPTFWDPFDVGFEKSLDRTTLISDLRANPFEERGNDAIRIDTISSTSRINPHSRLARNFRDIMVEPRRPSRARMRP